MDLVLDDGTVDLLTREAEVAVRMFRPAQLDLQARRCGATRTTFWASRGYVEAHGAPPDLAALVRHPLIGFDRLPSFLETAARMGFHLERDQFVLRTDDFGAMVMATRTALHTPTDAIAPRPMSDRSSQLRDARIYLAGGR